MADKVKQVLGIEPELITQGRGIFDVVVEDELVYSKFKTGTFPNEDQLIHELIAAYGSNAA